MNKRDESLTSWPNGVSGMGPFFREHFSGVYAFAFRIVGSQSVAEDLAIATFERCFWHPTPKEILSSPRVWLFRTTYDLALEARLSQDSCAEGGEPSSTPGDAGRNQGSGVGGDDVRDLLTRVPDQDARILLYYQAGMTFAEIAEALGVPERSVGPLLAEAEAGSEPAFQGIGRGSARKAGPA